jgi:hypothetical protein
MALRSAKYYVYDFVYFLPVNHCEVANNILVLNLVAAGK